MSVISSAYIRVVTKRIESIGANARVAFVASIAANKVHLSIATAPPVTSETVSIAVTMKYTKKNWHVKFTTHCTVGDTGNVAAGSTEWRDGRILPGQADGQHGSAAAGQRSYVLS